MIGDGLFVTGTDTGLGKTVIAAGLAGAMRVRGLRVGILKPIETGCGADLDVWPPDAKYLAQSIEWSGSIESVVPCRYREPLAPSVAARREGRPIDLNLIDRAWQGMSAAHDVTVVKGCGGLMVPIDENLFIADIAARLQIPIFIVARRSLGTLNHTGLTIQYARDRALRILGVILNGSAGADIAARTNAAELERMLEVPILGCVSHLGESPSPHQAFAAVEKAINVDALSDRIRTDQRAGPG